MHNLTSTTDYLPIMWHVTHIGIRLQTSIPLLLNALNLLALLGLAVLCCVATSFPLLIDGVYQILVAELAGWNNRRGINRSLAEKLQSQKSGKIWAEEKKQDSALVFDSKPLIEALAIVVGWREDEQLFEDCLQSYKAAKGCKFLIVGIDGDELEDGPMVDIFEKVYPASNRIIHFPQRLGEILESQSEEEMDDFLQSSGTKYVTHNLQRLCLYVEWHLREQLLPDSFENIRQLCIQQPHRSKKDILFSAFVVSLVVSDRLGLKYVWGSDSDTIVFPETLQRTLMLVHCDPEAGGASAKLKMLNKRPTMVTNMIASKYWYDQDVTRKQTAACKASECQPGPGAVFRISSLVEVIVPWYEQRIYGKRMISNEDRHLTSNLLRRGWKVHYAADAVVLTDAPSTFSSWVKQQVRWSRGTHIERIERPMIYLQKCPLFGFHVWKEQVCPILGGLSVVEYLIRGKMVLLVSFRDGVLRFTLQLLYTLLRSHEPAPRDSVIWILPALLFHYVPSPGIHVWSLMTAFEPSWGTTMRSVKARSKKESLGERWYQIGFMVIWLTIIVGFWVRLIQVSLLESTGYVLHGYFVYGSMVIASPLIYWALFCDLYVPKEVNIL